MAIELRLFRPSWQKDAGLTQFSSHPLEHERLLKRIKHTARAIHTQEDFQSIKILSQQWPDSTLFKSMHLSSEFLGVMSHPVMNDFWEQKKRYLLTNLYELIVGELKRLRQSVRRNLHVIAGGDVVESKYIELMQQCQDYVSEVERKSEGALSQWQEYYRLFHGLTTVIEQQYPSSHWIFEVIDRRQSLDGRLWVSS